MTHTINRVGSMISVQFTQNPVVDLESAALGNNDKLKIFFRGRLAAGVYIAPSAFESWFVTDALTYDDLDFTIAAVESVASNL